MAAPDLSEPTYQALAAISHDWLLPGIDTLPAGTTTLVESNRTFISAFLVGMNHELARELLWREYPTDQRGTYSRQFWAHRNTGNPADQYDLKHLLHASPQLTLEQLGEQPGDVASPLVLVVKGDLVQPLSGDAGDRGKDQEERVDPRARSGHRDPAGLHGAGSSRTCCWSASNR